jgi:protein-tyrosine phosphatase
MNGEGPSSRWANVIDLLKDLRPSICDALWSMSDPVPATRELGSTLIGVARKSVVRACKGVLPGALVDLLRGYRLLGPRDGRVYVYRGLLRVCRLRDDFGQQLPRHVASVLFVCHGNILRSPMAAALLAGALAGTERQPTIASAGLHAKPYGPADDRGCRAAVELGCSLERHESRMITSEMVEQADVIFVMDRLNEAKLLGRFPYAKGKVRLLGACEPDARQLDITDPYDGDLEDVRRCYERLARCVRHLATDLGGSVPLASSGRRTALNAESLPEPAGKQTWQTQHGQP